MIFSTSLWLVSLVKSGDCLTLSWSCVDHGGRTLLAVSSLRDKIERACGYLNLNPLKFGS